MARSELTRVWAWLATAPHDRATDEDPLTIGVVIAVMPFAVDHVNKPTVELVSTLVGGLAYGWLAWRTRSIPWGSIAHVSIVTLVTVAAGPATAAVVLTVTR